MSLIFIKKRVWNKLQGWKEKLLSQAGREVLLKVVVQAISTFVMSCFKLPFGLLKDIEMMIRKFWWGQRGDQRKIHWKNWETLCKPKVLGGMGFKDLEKFNEARLAKQVWRLLVYHSSLFYRVFSAKYFSSGLVFDAKVASGSYAWQSIVKARNLIQSGLLWRVGNSMKIKIYEDRWLLGRDSVCVISPKNEEASNWVVANFLTLGGEGWNDQVVDAFFLPFKAHRIKGIPLCVTYQEDCITWPRCRSGSYSIKKAINCCVKLS